MAHFNIDLDLDKSQAVGQVVRARVGDVESCVIAATIYDHGAEASLDGMTARFCLLKPDRTVVEDDDCEVSGSTVTHTLGTQATAAAGVAELAYFEILDGSTVIDSTQSFRLVIEPDAEGAGSGPSEDYISRVDAAVEAANDAAEAANSAAQKVDSASFEMGAVTTVASSEQASASLDGDGLQKTLNLSIPKGDKGDPGVGVPEGGEPGQLLSKTADGTAWVDPPSGNVLTGEAEGYVAHAEDAYAQKPREVRIKGRTWVNRFPSFTTVTGASGKITVSMAEDGLITLNAPEDTDSASYDRVYIPLGDNIVFTPNKSMTILVSTGNVSNINDADWYIYVTAYDEEDHRITQYEIRNQASMTTAVTPTNTGHLNVSVAVKTGVAINASFRIMLVDGTEAPDCFTPPASIASVQPEKLVTAGKNLLRTPSTGLPGGGVSVIKHDDGSITFNGTVTNAFWFYDIALDFRLPSGTYTLSGFSGYPEALRGGIRLELVGDGVSQKRLAGFYIPTFTVSNAVTVRFVISAIDGAEFDNVTIYPQLELGSTATAYEPPNVTQTPLPEVELRGLPNGTCDELVIKADGTCEVERKTGYIASYTDEEVTGEYVSTGNGLEAGASIVYELDEPSTEPQSPVTLPALPAPTFNQYHDASVPSDTSTEYERDINIAFSELQAQISATTVREATNG